MRVRTHFEVRASAICTLCGCDEDRDRQCGATEAAAAGLAARLRPGDVVLVSGELGQRQDDVRARRLPGRSASTEPVTSPTFTIGQVYGGDGAPEVAHLDLYRLESLDGEDPRCWTTT